MILKVEMVDVKRVTAQATVLVMSGTGRYACAVSGPYTIPVEDPTWWGARLGKMVELKVSDVGG